MLRQGAQPFIYDLSGSEYVILRHEYHSGEKEAWLAKSTRPSYFPKALSRLGIAQDRSRVTHELLPSNSDSSMGLRNPIAFPRIVRNVHSHST